MADDLATQLAVQAFLLAMTDARLATAEVTLTETQAALKAMADAAEMLWVVLANVSGGDWSVQADEWDEAASRFRDNYFAALKLGEAALGSSPDAKKE